jgi:enterochelin esterase-like enzyme
MRRKYYWLSLTLILVGGWLVYDWGTVWTGLQHAYYARQETPLFTETPTTTSRMDKFTFASAALNGVNKEVVVYLPPGYDSSPEKRYPVIYLLHGYPGSDTDWFINANLKPRLDELITNNTLPPVIAVSADANGPIIKDGQYLNATQVDQKMADFISQDLVGEIDQRYRTVATREGRALGGVSSGGYGAINMGLHQPEKFGYLFSLSGYFINQEGVTKKLLGTDQNIRDDNDPLTFLNAHEVKPLPTIFLHYGSHDFKNFKRDNEQMDQLLTSKGIPHKMLVTEGIHGWPLWKGEPTTQALTYLGEYLKTKGPNN